MNYQIYSMDTFIYIVLLAGAVIGFCQGAFKQAAQCAGIILGLILAASLYHSFGDMLADKTGTDTGFGRFMAFIIIAILVPLALGWAATLLTKLFQALHINFLNRLAGAAIGVICYGLFLSVALNLYDFLTSNAGFKSEKLEERPSIYYKVKHTSNVMLPDIIIVTDSTEIANGETPKHGLKSVVPNI